MPTMPYSPFTCHQEFLWVDHGEKFSILCKYFRNIQTQQNLDLTIILAQNLSSVWCITQFLLDNHYPTTYYHEGHTEDQLAKAKDSFYSRRNLSLSYPLKPTSNNLYTQPGLSLYGISPHLLLTINKTAKLW